MQNAKLIPTNAFYTSPKGTSKLITLNIKSCVGLILTWKEELVTLAHIADFNLNKEIFIKKCLKDIFNDLEKNGGIACECQIHLCGYEKHVNMVDDVLKNEYPKLEESVKYFNKYSSNQPNGEDCILVCIDKGKIIIEMGNSGKPQTLISLNQNSLGKKDEDFIKTIDNDKINSIYRTQYIDYLYFLNQTLRQIEFKSNEEEVKNKIEEFYNKNPMKNIIIRII
jgi:hypothetical protein